MAIYIHIPFCKKKCIYCDFTVIDTHNKVKDELFEEYSKLVVKEIEFYNELKVFKDSETLYLGGGSPSLVGEKNLSIILENVFKYVSKLKEITVEANPEDITESLSKVFLKLGVNRVSLGIQSMVDKNLKTLSRQNSYETNVRAIKILQDSGITNVNCDVIFDIPDSTLEELEFTLKELTKLEIPHISAYGLMIEDFTPLKLFVQRGLIKPKDNFEEEFLFIHEFLEGNGYIHYEISNYSVFSFESMHNLVYWKRKEYVGMGISACGFIGKIRYQNEINFNKYKEKLNDNIKPIMFCEEVELIEEFEETVMLGFRLKEGFFIDNLDILGKDKRKSFMTKAKEFEEKGLLKIDGNRIIPTVKGWVVSDYVVKELISIF